MPATFPKRSFKSDDQALLVNSVLDDVEVFGKFDEPFMVTVVTTDSGRCFIGLSGSNDKIGMKLSELLSVKRTVPELRKRDAPMFSNLASLKRNIADHQQLFDKQVNRHKAEFGEDVSVITDRFIGTSLSDYFTPEAQIKRLRGKTAAFGVIRFAQWDANVSRTNLNFKADWLLRELQREKSLSKAVEGFGEKTVVTKQTGLQGQLDQQLQAQHQRTLDLFHIKPNWNCSEPKALLGAAESGEGIEGMTTFWRGNSTDHVFAKYKLEDQSLLRSIVLTDSPKLRGKRELLLCRPCETCSQNEPRMMTTVEIVRIGKRGGGTAIWAEAPAALSCPKPEG